MILSPHPDPDYQRPNAAGLKFIGYWAPLGRKPDNLAQLTLPDPKLWVDRTWSIREQQRVLNHLSVGTMWEGWFGPSYCRFGCDDDRHDMGSTDLTDGVYVWPQGFAHYIERHAVKPPQEFIDHVLGGVQ
jgi:hypothetical protein